MDWYHGTTPEMAERAVAGGRFPDDYASAKAVWGPGVYMSHDRDEVNRWGTSHLRLDLAGAKLWDVSGEKWGWGPITVAENLPTQELRDFFRQETAYESPRFRFGGEVYGEVLREVVERMGYDGIIYEGDEESVWAVCYRPELVKVVEQLDAPTLAGMDELAPAPAKSEGKTQPGLDGP